MQSVLLRYPVLALLIICIKLFILYFCVFHCFKVLRCFNVFVSSAVDNIVGGKSQLISRLHNRMSFWSDGSVRSVWSENKVVGSNAKRIAVGSNTNGVTMSSIFSRQIKSRLVRYRHHRPIAALVNWNYARGFWKATWLYVWTQWAGDTSLELDD